MALGHPSVRPRFSICDPKLTYSVNAWQTACGTIDIISHLLEQYFHKEENIDVSGQHDHRDHEILDQMGAVGISEPERL